jgi:ATP-dependent RNA helicase SUPV3L1/SUV3
MSDNSQIQSPYINRFTAARAIKRHHHFFLGPTNSGKTYQALIALAQAESGVYLAPLRLLAMEIRDRLVEAGVPCNLITGEERTMMAGAKHTASTIEMMHQHNPVEVAIIDEIQMLQDPDRGSAWTAALVGVPAKQVFVCGSTAVTKPCIDVIEAMGETYALTMLVRKTPLVLEETTLCGKRYARNKLKDQLQKGDAFIAFSRKDILTYAARFRNWGYKVACIYGALSPEVRRAESARFSNGDADILVATDAIGMGLNLPIRRVVFCNIHKFDGVAPRPINATEVRQIAGRAGRYGIYETGYVNVLEDDETIHIAHMLYADDTADLTKLPIELAFTHISALADRQHTNRLAEILTQLETKIEGEDAHFEACSLTNQIQQAALIDVHAPNMALKDKYIFACAPISLSLNVEKDYFLLCLKSVYDSTARALPEAPDWLSSTNAQYLDAAEQLSQNISLYAWLSFKFPQVFIEVDQVIHFRKQVNGYISQALRLHRGFGDTAREIELVKSRY